MGVKGSHRPKHRHHWSYREMGRGREVSVCACGEQRSGRWRGDVMISKGRGVASYDAEQERMARYLAGKPTAEDVRRTLDGDPPWR